MKRIFFLLFIALCVKGSCFDNQTADISPILPPDSIPYKISIVLSDFQLPSDNLNAFGLQGFIYGVYKGKWLLLAGRTNGMHSFSNNGIDFPVQTQNLVVYV